jgi:RNA 2',3'-cyclic 3'-phosphodiesterase
MPSLQRAFVAVKIPSEVARAAYEGSASLREIGGVRWVPAENFHVTLKFLGPMTASQCEALTPALRQIAAAAAPFALALGGLGAFPRLESPRVVWLGIVVGREALADLATQMEEAAAEAGFAPEGKPYRAHVTLGRVKNVRETRSLSAALRAPQSAVYGPFTASSLALMDSERTPQGSRYTIIEEFPFGA